MTALVEQLTTVFGEPLMGALVKPSMAPFGDPFTVPGLTRPAPLLLLNSVVGTIFVVRPLETYLSDSAGLASARGVWDLLTKIISLFDAPYLGSFTQGIDAKRLISGIIIDMDMIIDQKLLFTEPLKRIKTAKNSDLPK
jgi:hypothetical protein